MKSYINKKLMRMSIGRIPERFYILASDNSSPNILYNLPYNDKQKPPISFKLYSWKSPSSVKEKQALFDEFNEHLISKAVLYGLCNNEFLYK